MIKNQVMWNELFSNADDLGKVYKIKFYKISFPKIQEGPWNWVEMPDSNT